MQKVVTPTASGRIKDKTKLVTCAPNFHCARLGSKVCNNRIVRDANNQSNVFYGQDTDVLGRPLHYMIDADSSQGVELEDFDDVKTNLIENYKNYALGERTGVCVPRKRNHR